MPIARDVAEPHTGERRHTRRWLVLPGILFLLIAWATLDVAYVAIGAENDYATHADVIIVLGCNIITDTDSGPSPCIRARAGHAANLYNQGLAEHIIATGGPEGNGPSEASVLAQVLASNGVPAAAIVEDEHALNTIQNMANSQAIMRERGWSTAILVTEPFHINRATLIARDDGMKVYPSPAVNSENWQGFLVKSDHILLDALSLMWYQVKSLIGQRE